jgi:hypothetical protein
MNYLRSLNHSHHQNRTKGGEMEGCDLKYLKKKKNTINGSQ